MSRHPRSPSVPIEDFPPGNLLALAALLHAWDYAHEVGRGVWDFAEELSSFQAIGVSHVDLRALLLKGLVIHAEEISNYSSLVRSFRKIKNLSLPEKTCFVLTKKGESIARTLPLPVVFRTSKPHGTQAPHENGDVLPEWNANLKELRVEESLVKRFLRPAPNQEIVLMSFQEQKWTVRIDDPLPRVPDRDAKQCLHDTINHLNRNLVNSLMHFSGDGTGRGIRWKFCGNQEAVHSHFLAPEAKITRARPGPGKIGPGFH